MAEDTLDREDDSTTAPDGSGSRVSAVKKQYASSPQSKAAIARLQKTARDPSADDFVPFGQNDDRIPGRSSFNSNKEFRRTNQVPQRRQVEKEREQNKEADNRQPRSRRSARSVTAADRLRRAGERKPKLTNKIIGKFVTRIINIQLLTYLWFFQVVMHALFLYFAITYSYGQSVTAGDVGRSLLSLDFLQASAATAAWIASNSLSPAGVIWPWMLSWVVMWFVLMVILLFLYGSKMSGGLIKLNPLNTSSKNGLFLMALIGYALPVLGALPWGVPWVWHIGKHPE